MPEVAAVAIETASFDPSVASEIGEADPLEDLSYLATDQQQFSTDHHSSVYFCSPAASGLKGNGQGGELRKSWLWFA